jgi:hypothetical protein
LDKQRFHDLFHFVCIGQIVVWQLYARFIVGYLSSF